jgi:hypothetical protein
MAGLKTVRTNPLRNTTRNKALFFLPPSPERIRIHTQSGVIIPLLEYSAQDPAELSYRPGVASLHRPDPMTIVVTPSLVVEVAYVKLPS